ncbi:MAG: TrkH family potassium uptake protein [Spirochaetota bacterium]
MKGLKVLLALPLLLSIVSLFLEQRNRNIAIMGMAVSVLDYLILFLLMLEFFISLSRAKFKGSYIKKNSFSFVFLALFVLFFTFNKTTFLSKSSLIYADLPLTVVIIRNSVMLLRILGRFRKLSELLVSISVRPAQTILFSFLIVILVGALLLMMPFCSAQGKGLSFINALFTATSAVCVTGLIVVDTATVFTLWGKLVILVLIQVGGLGIMILSYFVIFSIRRSVTLEDKFLLSYMLSEKDLSQLGSNIRSIIYTTFIIELAGAGLLFLGFVKKMGFHVKTFFLGLFHAVSAFCNAGFALFSDNLESFKSDLLIILVVSGLIILWGLSFSVIHNLLEVGKGNVLKLIKRSPMAIKKLSLNSKVVLGITIILLISGMLLFYALEHGNSLLSLDTGTQYLASFFQSVTARTAGFNTVPLSALLTVTYLVMIVYMFIGAAVGSTAGGIKVNTLALILAYISYFLKNKRAITILHHSVAQEQVLKAFMILGFGITVCFTGATLLSLSEKAPFIHLLFETVSAFGTVGLSAGITSSLTSFGKTVIIILMFLGRLGPLTILAAASRNIRDAKISYPRGDILIG